MIQITINATTNQRVIDVHVHLERPLEDGETLHLFRDSTDLGTLVEIDDQHYHLVNTMPDVTGTVVYQYMAQFTNPSGVTTDSPDFPVTCTLDARCEIMVIGQEETEVVPPSNPYINIVYVNATAEGGNAQQVTNGSSITNPNGDLVVTVELRDGTSSGIQIPVPDDMTLHLAVSGTNGFYRDYTTYITQFGFFGFNMTGSNSVTEGEIPDATDYNFTMVAYLADAQGNPTFATDAFSFNMKGLEPTLDYPVMDGLYRVWDVRFGLDMTTRIWQDKITGASPLYFYVGTESSDQSTTLIAKEDTRHSKDTLRMRRKTYGGFVGEFRETVRGFKLPPQWTVIVIGYPRRKWSQVTGEGSDTLLSYFGAQDGPFEGYYRDSNGQIVATSAKSVQPNYDSDETGRIYTITSDTTIGQQKFYTNSDYVETIDDSYTDDYGYASGFGSQWVRELFGQSSSWGADFQIGALIIYNRVLTPFEISYMDIYAEQYWYDPEF